MTVYRLTNFCIPTVLLLNSYERALGFTYYNSPYFAKINQVTIWKQPIALDVKNGLIRDMHSTK